MAEERELSLPAQGPFQLRGDFAPKEVAKAVVWSLFGLGLGALMAWGAVTELRAVAHTARVWEAGVEASGDILYEGSVTTHAAILVDYDLEVTFSLDDGTPVTFDSDFTRFFTGPDEGDPIQVRYLPDDPGQAATSWQHEALTDTRIWAGICALMAVGSPAMGLYLVWLSLSTLRKGKSLAQTGRIVAARLVDLKTVQNNTVVRVTYALPTGQTAKNEFLLKSGQPFVLEGGEEILALSSADGATCMALRNDGWPLAWPPQLPR